MFCVESWRQPAYVDRRLLDRSYRISSIRSTSQHFLAEDTHIQIPRK